MTDAKPKWNRRKEARPTEIIEAAMDVFVERGFAAARLDDVARRAGIVKGTLYRYFDTKEDLFRAVVQHAVAANFQAMEQAATALQGSLTEFVPLLLLRAAGRMGDVRVPTLARLVIRESQAFPDLARIWHDNVASRLLTLLASLIADAQNRGEVHPGDPRMHAFSIVGPMVTALLFHEVFGSSSPNAPDLDAFAAQHAKTVLRGLAMDQTSLKRPAGSV